MLTRRNTAQKATVNVSLVARVGRPWSCPRGPPSEAMGYSSLEGRPPTPSHKRSWAIPAMAAVLSRVMFPGTQPVRFLRPPAAVQS